MKKTIYNVYVVMESQEQCERMKQLCIDYGLPIWNDDIAFSFDTDNFNYFLHSLDLTFAVWLTLESIAEVTDFTKVTETEFIELLKEYKNVQTKF